MPEQSRLERLVASELGECCERDVQERLEALETYGEQVPQDHEADLSALTTLGDETRYTVVRLLAAADGELCVCEISPVVDVSDSAISHALSDLREAGLVTRRKAGTWRYYEATDRARALLAALDETRDVGEETHSAGEKTRGDSETTRDADEETTDADETGGDGQ